MNQNKKVGKEEKVEKIKKRLWERNISGEKGVELEGGGREGEKEEETKKKESVEKRGAKICEKKNWEL
jgi:hypothetical protein